ncbi:MAG: HlyD family efflux transporter periplasmic adaptor subunit [Phycisphaerae bacterium]|nr:HlyD family efflux transporter periplasmic adaptor subunit [Phycisphaerae bacterium]
MKKYLIVLFLIIAAISLGTAFWTHAKTPSARFRSVPISRGDLLITISATGTVEPVELIDVGAQVAGKIEFFGSDPNDPTKTIDYGTEVDEGTILAQIDDSLYRAIVDQAEAQVEQGRANVLRAEADLMQIKAKLQQAENNWKRAQELGPSRALSATDYDSYKAEYETALATVAVGEATVVQAKKSVVQAEAALKHSRTNLGYCTIKSPVKGVIIDRRVNIGQTVVASLNAPSLFLIAKDLTKMQVWAAVNEADIGNIYPNQRVTFTVDAFPGMTFEGTVGKIRLNASMTQNVVTYTVEIDTDNSDGQLLPYLTANLRFEVAERKGVLLVPNAALRWIPTPDQIAPGVDETILNGSAQSSGGASGQASKKGVIWFKDGPYARPVEVDVFLSDGSMTEIQSDDLEEGMEIIVGEYEAGVQADETTNPFTPKFPPRRRR